MDDKNQPLLGDLSSKHERQQERELRAMVRNEAGRAVRKQKGKIPKRFRNARWAKQTDRRIDALEAKVALLRNPDRDAQGFYQLLRRGAEDGHA